MDRRKNKKIAGPTGRFHVVREGLKNTIFDDFYHYLMNSSWLALLGIIAIAYLQINLVFATLYWLVDGSVANSGGSFLDSFFFSVQTMSGLGYGGMTPVGLYANIVVTVEMLTGLLWLAMCTGLIFAKFSRPTARVMFSRVAIIKDVDGVQQLMFRMVNVRANQIVEARIFATLLRSTISADGKEIRRMYDLEMVRDHTPIFAISWTARHRIDSNSPLYGQTPETIHTQDQELIVSLRGRDETFSQTIHARYCYGAADILWGVDFADIVSVLPNGTRHVDYRRFHDTVGEPYNPRR